MKEKGITILRISTDSNCDTSRKMNKRMTIFLNSLISLSEACSKCCQTSYYSISRRICSKKGSYIVESAIVLPVFLISVLIMSSIILMYACIEDCNFIAASELRRASAESIYSDISVVVPYRMKKAFEDDHSRIAASRTVDYGYRTSRWGQDELIAVTIRLRLASPNSLGIKADADYDIALVTRAYKGKVRNILNMSADELSGQDADPVFIFPKRGERYHDHGCGFLTAASKSGTLTSSLRRKYSSCPLCRSSKAPNGSLVYYFPAAGEAYHLARCPSLQRNYVEIDKKDALERGYTPCSKCGG